MGRNYISILSLMSIPDGATGIHTEHNEYASYQFICSAVKIASFRIIKAQTDIGFELTNVFTGQRVLQHTRFEQFLADHSIAYRHTRVGTPKHNGCVERHHGSTCRGINNASNLLHLMILG